MNNLNIDEAKRLYFEDYQSTPKIAKIFRCSNATIWRLFNKNGVKLNKSEILKRHIKTEEHKKNISLSTMGRVISEIQREKMRIGMLKAVERGHTGCFPKGHKPNITPERNEKISIASKVMDRTYMTGEKHHMWRGGVGFKYSRYLGNDIWDQIRWGILKRDKYICQKCGLESKSLHVHHKIPFIISKDDSDQNLISLCAPCYKKEEWAIQKKYYGEAS